MCPAASRGGKASARRRDYLPSRVKLPLSTKGGHTANCQFEVSDGRAPDRDPRLQFRVDESLALFSFSERSNASRRAVTNGGAGRSTSIPRPRSTRSFDVESLGDARRRRVSISPPGCRTLAQSVPRIRNTKTARRISNHRRSGISLNASAAVDCEIYFKQARAALRELRLPEEPLNRGLCSESLGGSLAPKSRCAAVL